MEGRERVPEDSGSAISSGVAVCPNCKAEMPSEMRFCRLCGYRIGEGVAEFTETVRLPGAPFRPVETRGQPPVVTSRPPLAPNFGVADTGYMTGWSRPPRRRFRWPIWIAIACAATAASFRGFQVRTPRVSELDDASKIGAKIGSAQNGALILVANPPGGPVDKAGIVGGDVINSIDGKAIQSEQQLSDLLGQTHAGKVLDVLYTRDGVSIATKITTITDAEVGDLKDAFDDQPGGQGKIGVRNYKQVDVPGLNIKGVRIGSVDKNYPANMAGIQAGDIVITFDGVPIRTAEEFASRIMRTKPKSTVPVEIVRGSDRQTIQLTIGEK